MLYLDFELKPKTLRKRMCMLSDQAPDNFHYLCLRGSERGPEIEDIEGLIEREGYGLVIIDSLYRTTWIVEENSNDEIGRSLGKLQRITKRFPVSFVLVDHTAKGGGKDRSAVDASRGASAKAGFVDGILLIRPVEVPGDDTQKVTFDPVLRDWPRFKLLPLVAFEWGDTSLKITREMDVPGGRLLCARSGCSPS